MAGLALADEKAGVRSHFLLDGKATLGTHQSRARFDLIGLSGGS